MGWLKYMLLGDLGQQLELNEQREELGKLRREAFMAQAMATREAPPGNRVDQRVAALESECDDLKLYVAVLTRLLVQKGVATQEDIAALVRLSTPKTARPTAVIRAPWDKVLA